MFIAVIIKKLRLINPHIFLSESIAIIGNSSCILNKKSGKVIDGYDEVVRFNRAKLKNYEDYVGTKTTLRVINNGTFERHKIKPGLGWNESDQDYDSRELYYLIGSDSLQTFHTWKKPEKILDECQVIVALRPGFLPSDISNRILRKVRFASIPRFEIGSSTIRSRWRENKTIRYMVTQPVWEYINDHGIYK